MHLPLDITYKKLELKNWFTSYKSTVIFLLFIFQTSQKTRTVKHFIKNGKKSEACKWRTAPSVSKPEKL